MPPKLELVTPADHDSPGAARHMEDLVDAPHIELALDYLSHLSQESGSVNPGYRDGQLFVYSQERCLYEPLPVRQAQVQIAARYVSCKMGRKWQDARHIADAAHAFAEAHMRLDDPPFGVATRTGFYRVEGGALVCEPLGPQHRCSFALSVDPDFDAPDPMWNTYLGRSFVGADAEPQRARAQEILGGVLMRLVARMHRAVLLYGPTRTGKSTFAKILSALVPPDAITSTSPTRWGHEYYCASLAGKLLNVVGELSGKDPIPGDVFKTVVGGDMLQGRHPNHRAFEFVCHAAHVFVSNYFPPSEDRSEAFFGRWAILHFSQQLRPEEIRPDFDRMLIERELPQILAWALRGAERLQRNGRLTPSAEHDRLLRKWQVNASSVLEFLNDESVCVLVDGARTRQPDLYGAYGTWCEQAGRRRIGRNSFFEDVDSQGAMLGVYRRKGRDADWVEGVSLVRAGEIPL
jgi:P4 family phage/plasmid primase-like protien